MSMAYTIDLIHDQRYACLAYTGDVTKSQLEDSREAVSLSLAANGWNKLLVDGTQATSTVSILEDFHFTREHRSHFSEDVLIALLIREEAITDFRFVVDVARSSSVNMKSFCDRKVAGQWLQGNGD